ncbi:SIMPL domain-containing protein [Vibrio astriarenae]
MKHLTSRLTLSATLVLGALLPLTSSAAGLDFPHIRTSGYGEITAAPDSAVVSIRVEETAQSAEEAKQQVDKAVETFLTQSQGKGLKREEMQSSNLHISPQYRYPKNAEPELVGYRATRTITLTINELESLNAYLDLAMQSGINRVDNIQLQTTEYDKFKQQALELAIKDAQTKAQSLAKGFGQQVDQVWEITYQQNQPRVMRAVAMDSNVESDSYTDKTIVIRDKVDVVFKISD